MALPATDTFLQTSGGNQTLTEYSANWTLSAGSFVVPDSAGAVASNSSGLDTMAFWNADTFNADQFSEVIVSSAWVGTGTYIGPAARVTAGGNGYMLQASSGDWYLSTLVSGAATLLANSTWTAAAGDVLRLEVTTLDASTVRIVVKRNGSVVTTYDHTDSSRHLSGSAGIAGYNATLTSGADDWTGNNLGATGYTLTADVGNIAISGQAAALYFNRVLLAEAGNIAINGEEAFRDLSMAALAGNIAIAGQDVTLTYTTVGAYILAADAGNFAISGLDVGVFHNRLVTADAGNVSISGPATGLLYHREVNAEVGNIGVAGSDAGLFFNRLLQAAAGNIPIDGVDATLIYTPFSGSYFLTAEGGVFRITGEDVTLTYTQVLTLTTADINAIVNAMFSDPRMLTVVKFLSLKDL